MINGRGWKTVPGMFRFTGTFDSSISEDMEICEKWEALMSSKKLTTARVYKLVKHGSLSLDSSRKFALYREGKEMKSL